MSAAGGAESEWGCSTNICCVICCSMLRYGDLGDSIEEDKFLYFKILNYTCDATFLSF